MLIVTGGCGFVGSNLINYLVQNTNYKIISLDDYSSGIKKNQIKNKNVKYINGNTKNISKILNSKKKELKQFSISVSSQEFTKVLNKWINVFNQIQ